MSPNFVIFYKISKIKFFKSNISNLNKNWRVIRIATYPWSFKYDICWYKMVNKPLLFYVLKNKLVTIFVSELVCKNRNHLDLKSSQELPYSSKTSLVGLVAESKYYLIDLLPVLVWCLWCLKWYLEMYNCTWSHQNNYIYFTSSAKSSKFSKDIS